MNNIFNKHFKEIPYNEEYYINKHGDIWRVTEEGELKRISTFAANGVVMCKLHRRSVSVARLVAELFLPNDHKERTRVYHIDGDMWNNDISNLIWCTPSEVMKLRFIEPEDVLNALRDIRLEEDESK